VDPAYDLRRSVQTATPIEAEIAPQEWVPTAAAAALGSRAPIAETVPVASSAPFQQAANVALAAARWRGRTRRRVRAELEPARRPVVALSPPHHVAQDREWASGADAAAAYFEAGAGTDVREDVEEDENEEHRWQRQEPEPMHWAVEALVQGHAAADVVDAVGGWHRCRADGHRGPDRSGAATPLSRCVQTAHGN
jgi:hypothetical protein